jgi:DNA-binding XRE family transcriptional regulator
VNKKLFAELVESMEQMNEIARGERAPSREFHVEPLAIKELRSKLGLRQSEPAEAQGARRRAVIQRSAHRVASRRIDRLSVRDPRAAVAPHRLPLR